MADSLGNLIVSLAAETAQFTSAMEKAAYLMDAKMGEMVKSVKGLQVAMTELDGKLAGFGTSLRGLFGIVAVGGFATLVKSAIDSQAELGRLAQRANVTVEALSGMRKSAKEGGIGLDEAALAMNRLSKAVFEGQDKSTKAADALGLIGLKAKDLVVLAPDQALLTVARALSTFGDSAGKSAVEMEILGKSGPKVGAFLDDLAAKGLVAANVTTAMAREARETEARFNELTGATNTLAIHAANQLLPALNSILEAFNGLRQGQEESLGVWGALAEAMRVFALGLATVHGLLTVDLNLLRYFYELLQIKVGVGFVASVDAAFDRFKTRAENAVTQLNTFYTTLAATSPLLAGLAGRDAPKSDGVNRSPFNYGDDYKKKNIGVLPNKGAGAAKDDPAKALLETQIRELERYLDREKQLLTTRDQYLAFYYGHGYLSEKQYFDTRSQLLQAELAVQVDAYNKELAALDRYVAHLKTVKNSQKAQQEAEKQRVDIESKIQKAQLEAASKTGLFSLESQAAAENYQIALRGINAQLLALQHNTAEANAITFADQHLVERRKLEAAGDTQALAQLAEIGAREQAQAKLNDVTYRYGLLIQQVGINQSIADLKFKAGAITELDAYNQKADAARQMIPLLTQVAERYEAIAATSKDPGALIAAQNLRLEIARLAVDADALAKKFTDIFSGAFTTFLTDLVGHTKSVKQAFLDMAKSIDQSITQIAAKNVSEKLFAKDGPLGGIGDFFAKAIGGDKGAGSATADAALSALSGSATSASTALAADVQAYLAIQVAAQSAATALAAVGASGGASGASSLLGGAGSLFGSGGSEAGLGAFDAVAGFADGTNFAPGGLAWVGERGKELVRLPRGAQVIPNHVLNSRRDSKTVNATNNISINVPFNTSGASASQQSLEAAKQVQRAMRLS